MPDLIPTGSSFVPFRTSETRLQNQLQLEINLPQEDPTSFLKNLHEYNTGYSFPSHSASPLNYNLNNYCNFATLNETNVELLLGKIEFKTTPLNLNRSVTLSENANNVKSSQNCKPYGASAFIDQLSTEDLRPLDYSITNLN